MTFDASKYQQGYSIGVGAVVLCDKKVLLVRSALGEGKGDWALPGGFVEQSETIDCAVQREVWEEAGVKAELRGLIGARSRVTSNENSAYFIFLLQANTDEVHADGFEVDEAQYFTLAEVQTLPRLRGLSRLMITRVFEGDVSVLTFHPHPPFSPSEFVLFL